MEEVTLLQILETVIVPVIIAVLASSGFWVFIERRRMPKYMQTELLIGLAHDRIMYLGSKYILRGSITSDEYENLHKYLYTPYRNLGGNGTVERLMVDINKLPMRPPSSQSISQKGDNNNAIK